MAEEQNSDYLDSIRRRIEEKKAAMEASRKKAVSGMQGGILMTVLLLAVGYYFYLHRNFIIWHILSWLFAVMAFICIMVAVSCYFDRKKTGADEMELESMKEELELEQIPYQNIIVRADKQFKLHQKELKRYYDMNLSQTRFLCGLGIFLILFGLGVIAGSIIAYINLKNDLCLLLVGAVSGILIDFVGAVFISMYTQNLKTAVEFHSKLASSNNLLLANSIANKIEDIELREKTLSEISMGIAKH